MTLKTTLIIITLSLVILPCLSEVQKQKALTVVEDSFVSDGASYDRQKNYGNSQLLLACGNRDFVFLKFDLSNIPPNSSIKSANLKLHTWNMRYIEETKVYVHFCSDNSWSENNICWNNKPSFESTYLDSVVISQTDLPYNGKWYIWDVTDSCRTAYFSADKDMSFVLCADPDVDHGINYLAPMLASRETSDEPRLVISYTELQKSTDNGDNSELKVPMELAVIVIAVSAISVLLASLYIFRKNRTEGKKSNIT